ERGDGGHGRPVERAQGLTKAPEPVRTAEVPREPDGPAHEVHDHEAMSLVRVSHGRSDTDGSGGPVQGGFAGTVRSELASSATVHAHDEASRGGVHTETGVDGSPEQTPTPSRAPGFSESRNVRENLRRYQVAGTGTRIALRHVMNPMTEITR